MTAKKRKEQLLLALLCLPYLLYVYFIVSHNRGPIDYETFMEIGGRLLAGQEVYGINSYYPLPYVFIFAFFCWLPRPLSMALWLLLPVIAALIIARGKPWVLAYAPVLGHFLGGQSSLFGLLGLAGYRRNADPHSAAGGFWLALTLIKPQLGIFPVLWAAFQWFKALRAENRVPRQAWGFLATAAGIYLPSFLLQPDWPQRWLSYPRPLSLRAMSGLFPRSLYLLVPPNGLLFWLLLGSLSLGLLWVVWRACHNQLPLDAFVLWSFVASPLVHDYDLLQLVPLLDTPPLQRAALWVSIPGWLVIIFAYQNDAAWFAYTLFAPLLLWVYLRQQRPSLAAVEQPA